MKNLLTLFAIVFTVCFSVCAHNKPETKNDAEKKAIVVFFSATGTTKSVAEKIAELADADLLEIVPVRTYTSADLNWRDRKSRSSVEMKNPESRPAIKDPAKNAAEYDIIYLGYPIWWNLAPTIVNTYIEEAGLNGKKVVPFATSGGSNIENSVANLKKRYPAIDWRNGKLFNNPADKDIAEWILK